MFLDTDLSVGNGDSISYVQASIHINKALDEPSRSRSACLGSNQLNARERRLKVLGELGRVETRSIDRRMASTPTLREAVDEDRLKKFNGSISRGEQRKVCFKTSITPLIVHFASIVALVSFCGFVGCPVELQLPLLSLIFSQNSGVSTVQQVRSDNC
jgi:hypothetical protein